MRKTIIFILLAIAIFMCGRAAGVRHALYDCEIFMTECYDPDHPELTRGEDGADITVFVELDGAVHEYGAYVY
ncbi:MAG: hypothetical protein IJG15_05215 [Lachnospiraceae bacterium]|nr:hypothetical protein [Lachnospiraceae bacterium]